MVGRHRHRRLRRRPARRPQALGLDAIFPAFYLALLAEEMRDRSMFASALLGGAIALVLIPFTPPGIPVVAAALAALLGVRSR